MGGHACKHGPKISPAQFLPSKVYFELEAALKSFGNANDASAHEELKRHLSWLIAPGWCDRICTLLHSRMCRADCSNMPVVDAVLNLIGSLFCPDMKDAAVLVFYILTGVSDCPVEVLVASLGDMRMLFCEGCQRLNLFPRTLVTTGENGKSVRTYLSNVVNSAVVSERNYISQSDFTKVLAHDQDILRVFIHVMLVVFLKQQYPSIYCDDSLALLPLFEDFRTFPEFRSILNPFTAAVLRRRLPLDEGKLWRFRYSSTSHGESFTTCIQSLMKQGPCLLLVQDKDGYVFGAYTSEDWHDNGRFYGDGQCFLFQLEPAVMFFTDTGYNKNYMYLNCTAKTLPRGLGLGGQLNYFGLWIDAEFSHGHSRASPVCSTYGSCVLSKNSDFEISCVEVWAVGNPMEGENEVVEKSRSVLSRSLEDQAILHIAGRTRHSEAFGEE